MPYLIRRPGQKRLATVVSAVLLGAGVSALTAAPALADPPSSASSCTMPALTQPFLAWGDQSTYALPTGESLNNFDGSGWTLTGGASVETTTLANGDTGSVLNLPSGSEAVSPVMCIDEDFPVARTMVRNVVGGEGVQFFVSVEGTNTWGHPQNTGQVHGQQNNWSLSDSVNLNNNLRGWQLAQFTFIPGGNPSNPSDFQLYNFYVDPYAKGH